MESIHSKCKEFINSGKICYSCGRELCRNNKCKKKQQCGILKTLEHIPPKSLFEQNKGFSNINANPEENKITVSCCGKCNNTYSKDDEIFVTFITMIASRTSKIAEYAYEKNRVRGIRKNRRLLRDIQNNIKGWANIKSPLGIYSGEKVRTLVVPKEIRISMFNVLKKIVKGYYYKRTNNFLDEELIKYGWDNFFFKQNAITGYYGNNKISEDTIKVIREIERGKKEIREGNSVIYVYTEDIKAGVFSYSFCDYPKDDTDRRIIFVMTFYDSQKFIFYT